MRLVLILAGHVQLLCVLAAAIINVREVDRVYTHTRPVGDVCRRGRQNYRARDIQKQQGVKQSKLGFHFLIPGCLMQKGPVSLLAYWTSHLVVASWSSI